MLLSRNLFLLLFLISSVYSYTITSAEYFIDSDPGEGNGFQLNVPVGESSYDIDIDIEKIALPKENNLIIEDHRWHDQMVSNWDLMQMSSH